MRDFLKGLFGNRDTKNRIGQAVLDERMPHAFLIDGYEGSGKLTLALEIAAALVCEEKSNPDKALPCHECPACRKVFSRSHVDVKIVERDEGKQIMSVDKARFIRRDMFMSPTEAEYKIYIMRDADKMNTEAQNALLIALEEPPQNVVIILLASGTDKILTTIKSRAQYIAMERFTREKITEYLLGTLPEARGIMESDRNGYELALIAADGRIGPAKSLIMPSERQELLSRREDILSLFSAIDSGDYTGIRDAFSVLPQDRYKLSLMLEEISVAIRDMITVYYTEDAPLSFFLTSEDASETSYKIGLSKLYKLYDVIQKAHDDLSKMANVNALVSLLIAKIKTL